jgi:hypothetical protein
MVKNLRTYSLDILQNNTVIYVKNLKYNNDSYHEITKNELECLKIIASKDTIRGRKVKKMLETSKYLINQ